MSRGNGDEHPDGCACRESITVEMSRAAATFLWATVRHMNQRKILPDDPGPALQTSAWLEEIEAAVAKAGGLH
jgi:hypothetical protein